MQQSQILYNNAVKTTDISGTRNVNLAIISKMESARYARRKVERGVKGEADL